LKVQEEVAQMKTFLTLTVAASALVFAGSIAEAASPTGTWKRPSTGATYKVSKCGGGVKLRVIKHPNSKWNGKTISSCAKKSGGNKWVGTITSTDDGKQYSGSMTLKGANRLRLEGCAVLGLVCKGETMKRIN